jgi:hypothetical protein
MNYLISIPIILTMGLFIGGFAANRQWDLALAALGVGALWLVGEKQHWRGLASPAFLTLVALAGLGVYRGVAPLWMFLGTVAALISWDLDHFVTYLAQAEDIEAETTLQQAHFKRLQLTAILSLLLGGAALALQLNLTFGLAIFLTLLMVVSLALAVRFIRRGV